VDAYARATGTVLTDDAPSAPGDTEAGQPQAGGWPRRLLGVAAGALAALVLALVVSSAFGGSDPAPSTTTTAVRAPLPATTADDPAPVGTRVALGNGWTVAVLAFNPDATRALAPLNRDAPALEEGQVRVLIGIEMTYIDGMPDTESPFLGVDLSVRDADGNVTTPADTPCSVGDSELYTTTEMTRGEGRRGNICFAVDAESVDSLLLVASPSMAFGARPSYFELRRDE
jgi:hypothetical protein